MRNPPDGYSIYDNVWIREWDVWDVECITDRGVHITRRDCPHPDGIPGDSLIKSERSGHTVEIYYDPANPFGRGLVYTLRYNIGGELYDLPNLSEYWIGKYRDLMELCYVYPDELMRFVPDLIRFLHKYDHSGEEVLRL